MKNWFRFLSVLSVTVVTLSTVGVSLWSIRQYWVYMGFFFAVMMGTAGVIALIKWWYYPHVHHIAEHGTLIYHHGTHTLHAPHTRLREALEVNGEATGSVTVAEIGSQDNLQIGSPSIPRLAELIRSDLLFSESEDGIQMLQGIYEDGQIRYGQWPGVIGVAGMQNTGKSVTIATLAIIPLLQGAKVVVCDTHHNKPRSLYKKLAPLEGYITFARTEAEVSRQAFLFSEQLVKRKEGADCTPYIFVLDECASVIRSPIGEKITLIIEEASQEGHGYNLHMVIGIHDFSKDGLGDARIRDFLNMAYCHRMQPGQSKFLQCFSTKDKQSIAGLPQGHCYIRDECNDIEHLVMPLCEREDTIIARNHLDTMTSKRLPGDFQETRHRLPSPSATEPLEVNGEAVGSMGSQSSYERETIADDTLALMLRTIGKRLQKGESLDDIRKSLGATQGRASQEVHLALVTLEQQARGSEASA